MEQQDHLLLRSPWLHVARLAWLVLISASVVMFLLALPPRYAQLMADPYGLRPGLEELGLTVRHFVNYDLALSILVSIGFIAFALLLFLKGSRELVVLLFSLAIGMFIIIILPVTSVLPEVNPAWQAPQLLLRGVGFASFSAALLLFPDGRFVPRWTGFGLMIIVIYILLWPIFPRLAPLSALDFRVQPSNISVILLAFLIALVVSIQVYRYRHVSTLTQRQQTHWVVLGLAFEMANLILVTLPGIFWRPIQTSSLALTVYLLVGIPIVLFSMLLFPLSLVISILRYRLWDIDIVIRKTLVYSLLSGLLGLVYFSGVTLLQTILTADRGPLAAGGVVGGRPPAVVIVITTLAIAVLFNPLRRRIQDFIDRRFYRQKYNAEKALAQFAAAARSETDTDKLTRSMLDTVQSTLQPTAVSVWLKTAPGRK